MTDLRDAFADGDYELVLEALYALRERKQEALREVKQWPPGATFTARDFGIPQIDAILKRLDAEPAPDTPAPEQPAASPLVLSDPKLQGAVALILRDVCETTKADPDDWNTVCINLEELGQILDRRINKEPGTAPAPGQIGIRLEGGVIQSLWTDRPMDVVVIDYDTEGRSADEIFPMPQSDGRTSECIVEEYAASVMPEECQRIREALATRSAADEDAPEGMSP